MNKSDLILITGAGGFIGGSLARSFHERGFTRIRAVDKKPLSDWYQRIPGVESLCLDVSEPKNCVRACEGAVEVYNLAADMGGMGFIERFRVECLRSILINTHMIEAAWRAGRRAVFLSPPRPASTTPICRRTPVSTALKESDAYPAMAERGYGWEKLMSEMFCQEYWAERGLKTFIARFHNVYGPNGTWDGGREKAPAAICRKVIEAKDKGRGTIEIWGDGTQTRSFMYIDDCVKGIDMIMHCRGSHRDAHQPGLERTRLGRRARLHRRGASPGVKLERRYDLSAPKGVGGRNSDNTMIQKILKWEPSTPLKAGLKKTYDWIEQQYMDRKAGKRTVE